MRPATDNVRTSPKPTVDMVITDIYNPSKKPYPSMIIKPAAPNNMVNSSINTGNSNLEKICIFFTPINCIIYLLLKIITLMGNEGDKRIKQEYDISHW